MKPGALLLLLCFLALPLSAQLHFDAGLAVGMQPQESEADDPKPLVGAEALVHNGRYGVHAAYEYASLTYAGGASATHADLVFRHTFANHFSILAGAGPTFVSVFDYGTEFTWNAEAEIARRFGRRNDIFVRARYYDYEQTGFRDFVSPSGPAIYLGWRMAFRD
ncbi:MAG TPA: hypothetical protein VKB93_18415 [Thermoanaerobaculia bacterium]|nr:hypothetical protein [Thermoanaerobaculia bacterium]